MRKDGIFIAVEVDDAHRGRPGDFPQAADRGVPRRYLRPGPATARSRSSRRTAADECVLCRLCLDAVNADPTHPVKVIKLYDDDAVLLLAMASPRRRHGPGR